MGKKSVVFGSLAIVVVLAVTSAPLHKVSAVALGEFTYHSNTGTSGRPVTDMSQDGKYIVYYGSTLLPGETSTNGRQHVFIHDTVQNQTTRISTNSAGQMANGDSVDPTISADGRFIAFQSYATDLITNDTNAVADIFLYDRVLNKITRESMSPSGVQPDKLSMHPFISEDGEYLAFVTKATNLLPGTSSTNGNDHLYIKNLITHSLVRASVNQLGELSNGSIYRPVISADNEFISFESNATNLLLTPINRNDFDYNMKNDVYRYTTRSKSFELVSKSATNGTANDNSGIPSISADGRYVTYVSSATDLTSTTVPTGVPQIYVRDLQTSTTELITKDWQNNGAAIKGSSAPKISGDGRYVIFTSSADNLIQNDTYRSSSPTYIDRTYLKDRQAATIDIVSVKIGSYPTFAHMSDAGTAINTSGNLIAFTTYERLVANDTNNSNEIYTRTISAN